MIIYVTWKKFLTNFSLFEYLTNYLRLKLRTNENIQRRGALLWTGRHQAVVYAVTQIPLLSLQCCRNFQTRKVSCNAIWFYVNYIEHVKFFVNNITSWQDKHTNVNVSYNL